MLTKRMHLSISIVLFVISTTFADVRLPSIINSNMVLQKKSKVTLWGWADKNEVVKISTGWGQKVTTTASTDKKWNVTIATPRAGGPYSITIEGKNIIVLGNVLIGEVWVCSGQSNMEWIMANSENPENEIAEADYPFIRLFDVKNEFSLEPKEDCVGSWEICDSQTVYDFSAVAYFFGKKIYTQLNVPIGLISTNWGGTPAQAWTSIDYLETVPGFEEQLKLLKDKDKLNKASSDYKTDLKKWNKTVADSDKGLKQKWYDTETDTSNWKTMKIPTRWEDAEIGKLDGIVWFTKTVTVSKDLTGKDMSLELGAIDDGDITYFNGVQVGHMNNWSAPRKYNIPAKLVKEGENIITIRVYDTYGAGGLTGPAEIMKLTKKNEPNKSIALDGGWKYKIGMDYKDLPPKPQPPKLNNQNAPGTLFNAMINPIIPFGIRGAIWYQGESNTGNPQQYKTLFPTMIQCWRDKWQQGDFPFYFVQIAPYENYKVNSAFLREAQFMTLSVKNTGMAVTTDITNLKDIHPKNKKDVGYRLARWALAKTYGQEVVYSGPLYKKMEVEGDKIRLYFNHVDGGLVAMGGKLTEFRICGEDKNFVDAKAEIDGDTVIVFSEDVNEPVAVRFGFNNTATPNLFNKEGLPATTFRTDDWNL